MKALAGVGVSKALLNGQEGEKARLREACENFEAIFLAMLFREVKADATREGLLSGGIGGEVFNGMWVEELARAGARSSPLGMADMLFEKLSSRAGLTSSEQEKKPKT